MGDDSDDDNLLNDEEIKKCQDVFNKVSKGSDYICKHSFKN
jgi:hypothetical protein